MGRSAGTEEKTSAKGDTDQPPTQPAVGTEQSRSVAEEVKVSEPEKAEENESKPDSSGDDK